jgi:hypothetical protein
MNDPKEKVVFAELVLYALQGTIDETQLRTLRKTLANDPDAVSLYLDLMEIYTELSPLGAVHIQGEKGVSEDCQIQELNDLLSLLMKEEATAPVTIIEKPVEHTPLVYKVNRPPLEKKQSKTLLWVSISSMAALFIVIASLVLLPHFQPISVATVLDSIDTGPESEALMPGKRLTNQKTFYTIQQGIAKIQFDSGASVIVEGPAEFCLKNSNAMVLRQGKIFAFVPGQAQGFSVSTPDSTIVDLGTEFGITVLPNQGTELHVFSGLTQILFPGSSRTDSVQDVTAGQARRINAAAERIETIPLSEYQFVRQIDSDRKMISKGNDLVSLCDLVLGGSGYGSAEKPSFNCDPNTGQILEFFTGEHRKVEKAYRKVQACPYIDGIFVPNGKNQVVTSQGHVFEECPDTNGMYFNDLGFNSQYRYFPQIEKQYAGDRKLNFPTSRLFMHSNLGLTIDLNAVRRHFPGQEISRFLTAVGTAYANEYGVIMAVEEMAPSISQFDVWITVDGKLRSRAQQVRWDSLLTLEVPLEPQDRFLSILVTDGGVIVEEIIASHYDLCLLADPRFELTIIR